MLITSAWGLGETVVQGRVNPDEFYVHKPNLAAGRPPILRRERGSKAQKMVYGDGPAERVAVVDVAPADRHRFSLTDGEVIELARHAVAIERHYGRAMDIEWARDGVDGRLYVLQARPETVQSRLAGQAVERFELKARGEVLVEGRSIGQRIGAGTARLVLDTAQMDKVRDGDVLVTGMTDPDWEPVMKRAAAIVTNRGGRTCHAAIIARELGIPAVVGTGDATRTVGEGTEVTVSCAEGDTGFVYAGRLDFELRRLDVETMPALPFKVAMNVGNPDRAFSFRALPNAGVGLARLEFIIGNSIGVHPRALLEFDRLHEALRERVRERIAGYTSPESFFVEKLVEGVATIAAAFHPEPVIVRLSDFKSDEYANLVGGELYEPAEANPMLGFRGASRYVSDEFRACFELECRAMRRVRDEMGFANVELMVPFVRTLDEAREVVDLLARNGLERGRNGLRMVMMCEVPSNAILAEEFLEFFDGFSIGSNDLTQMTLGLDRNSELVASRFDERDPAVKALLHRAIAACRKQGKYVGICGQGPSDHPDLARWLMEQGIDSVSLNPDTRGGGDVAVPRGGCRVSRRACTRRQSTGFLGRDDVPRCRDATDPNAETPDPRTSLRAVRRTAAFETRSTPSSTDTFIITLVSPEGCSTDTSFSAPSGTRARARAVEPGSTHAVATLTAPSTPMEAWQRWGMKVRVAMAPPARGGAARVIFGTDLSRTSPRFMSGPARRRMDSSRSFSAPFASRSSRLSQPVIPRSEARIATTGIPLSMQVTSTPSIASTGFPVGSNVPQVEPAASGKFCSTGAAVPGTPSIRALPS